MANVQDFSSSAIPGHPGTLKRAALRGQGEQEGTMKDMHCNRFDSEDRLACCLFLLCSSKYSSMVAARCLHNRFRSNCQCMVTRN